MERRIAAALAVALLTAGTASAQSPFPRDPNELVVLAPAAPDVRKATAVVNGEVITDTDIEHRLNLVLAANQGRVTPDERERLRLQVLRNLIDEKLQVQEAANKEIRISDSDVDETFARVARNFQRTPAQFEQYLREQGASAASLKQQIRAELAWSRLLRRRVEPFVNVGDEEVQAVIKRLEESRGRDEWRVGEIFLEATPETEAAAMDTARNIVRQIRQGASFVAYARQFGQSASAALGGDLGWVRPEQLPDSARQALEPLERGQITEPVRVPGGIAIMALIDKRSALTGDPSRAVLNLKQLSVDFTPQTTDQQATAAVQKLVAATRNMGGCGNAERAAAEAGATLTSSDQLVMGELPEPLQDLIGRMKIGEATPPFGNRAEGVRVLVLCGRDDPAPRTPSFEEVHAQMSEARVGMMARRYLRDLRRDAIVDYR